MFEKILIKCSRKRFDKKELLLYCALKANPWIGLYVYDSIIHGTKYRTICEKYGVPIDKAEFKQSVKLTIKYFNRRMKDE